MLLANIWSFNAIAFANENRSGFITRKRTRCRIPRVPNIKKESLKAYPVFFKLNKSNIVIHKKNDAVSVLKYPVFKQKKRQ